MNHLDRKHTTLFKSLREIPSRLFRGKAGGFTLIELMVVIVIIGILGGVSAPTFRGYLQTQKIATASSDLITSLRFARLRAVSERNPWVVIFQVASQQYVVFSDNGGGGGVATSPQYVEDHRQNLKPDPGEWVLPARTLPAGVIFDFVTAENLPNNITTSRAISFGGSPPRIVFYPNGSARETGVIMLHLEERVQEQDPTGQRAIILYKPTGAARSLKYNPAGNPYWK